MSILILDWLPYPTKIKRRYQQHYDDVIHSHALPRAISFNSTKIKNNNM